MSIIMKKFYGNAERFPQKIAVCCNGETVTYRELRILADGLACILRNEGIRRGDHICVLLPNTIYFVALILAAAELGCALVPLNLSIKAEAVKKICSAANVKHIIGNAVNLEEQANIEIDGLKLSMDRKSNGAKYYQDLMKKTILSMDTAVEEVSDDIPLILTLTSGSTGSPKPIVLSQKNKYDRAMAAVRLYGITSEDKILAATPLYHSLAERLVLIPLLLGGTCILLHGFSPTVWVECVKQKHVTFTIAVSSQISQITETLSETNGLNDCVLRCLVSSSAPLEAGIKEKLRSILKCDLHECYGTSETAIATSINITQLPEKLQSVGTKTPETDIKILRDNKTFCSSMETGEITVKTPMLFCGYYGMPEATEQAMFEGYFCTGDYGYMDEDGFLYFSGRKKDIIISGGINIYPSDVERVIKQIKGVKECMAFSLPDKRLGEIVAVAVVMNKGEYFDKKAARSYCMRHLADYQQPRKYFLVDEFPKNSMGKYSRYILTEMFSK